MRLLAKLTELVNEQNFEEAKKIALHIETSKYPSSLKSVARKLLRKLGREQDKSENIYSMRLHQATCPKQGINKEISHLSWLPWKIIFDGINQSNQVPSLEGALELYNKSYLSEGVHTLHYLRRPSNELIKAVISDLIDCEYYLESHPDLIGASNEDALLHYTIYGGLEESRKPNRLFNNEDMYNLYPWIRQLDTNALYLFARWPEQFPKIVELVGKRHDLSKNILSLPWNRPAALAAIEKNIPSNFDYLRVLAITKENSNKQRLIALNSQHLNIHIVIPDFTAGGGGHMTIFRMILHLEEAGHQCTVWVKDFDYLRHPEGPRISAFNNYQPIKAQVLPLSAHYAFTSGDALIATSWDTVEIVCANKNFHDYFYLVQDYEPYFYPRGSEALEAELTYMANLKTICASPWLDSIMREKFNRKSTYFSLSYNPSLYNCEGKHNDPRDIAKAISKATEAQENKKPIVRIAFYARLRTDRRAVSLALKGLEKLEEKQYTICIELFGANQGDVCLPSNVIGYDNGILTPSQLSELYHSCDIGLTFSATNYALVPQEMMACGLPVIEIDNESTKAIYPKDILLLAKPSAQGIANAIDELAVDKQKRQSIARRGLKWVQQTSWKHSFKRVEEFIRSETISSAASSCYLPSIKDRYLNQDYKTIKLATASDYCASIVIPTYQGGALLQEVIDKVQSQMMQGPFEIIIIDSGSKDGSIESLALSPNMSLYSINQQNFQHGKTRNLGVALSNSQYVAFITQDAIPSNDYWLSNLIKPLQDHIEVQAVFGAHRAHLSHPEYLDDWLMTHFNSFQNHILQRKSNNLKEYYQEHPKYRQLLHFYSDNNSCLRKDSWAQYPYPDVSYGEDQLWCDWIIQNDGTRAYAPDAVVLHSHHYTEKQEYERAKEEAFFFLKYFGYKLGQNRLEIEVGIEQEAKRILNSTEFTIKNSKDHLLKLLRSKREGYHDGVNDFFLWLKTNA